MLLKNKKILITGVITRQSIAYFVAKKAQEQGAQLILTSGPGKTLRLTSKMAKTLDPAPPVLQMDVTDEEQIAQVAKEVQERWGTLDGLLHAIAFAPSSCIGTSFLETPWKDVSAAFQVSAYSLAALGRAFSPLMKNGSIVALDFDAEKVWEHYNWMGVCKAGLETISRYMAKELGSKYGIRVNCIASGPIHTLSAKCIDGFSDFEEIWIDRSILDWSLKESAEDVADASIFLFSDLSRKITGEKLHVDGGFHIMGSPVAKDE